MIVYILTVVTNIFGSTVTFIEEYQNELQCLDKAAIYSRSKYVKSVSCKLVASEK